MTTIGRDTTITWLGHATFHIRTPGGKNVIIDPWITGNPTFPSTWMERAHAPIDAIFVTHGHADHVGDVGSVAAQSGAPVVCIVELAAWLQMTQGVAAAQVVAMNKGGTVSVAGIEATMTTANHSSSAQSDAGPVFVGSEAGFVLRLENGFTIYIAGDTAVTYDMLIVGDLYQPDLTILPIGDHFTMGPRQAAYALKLIRSKYAIGGHYGTFPLLTGTPAKLRAHMAEFGVTTELIELEPGESVS